MAEEEQQLVFDDALFRQKRKHGRFRLVEPPRLAGPVVDTHAHVPLLADPALEFARCAAWGVGFVCDIIDVQEDAPNVFERFDGWFAEARSRLPEAVERTREVLAAGGDELTHLPDGADAACFALPADAASRPLPPEAGQPHSCAAYRPPRHWPPRVPRRPASRGLSTQRPRRRRRQTARSRASQTAAHRCDSAPVTFEARAAKTAFPP